MAGIVESWPCAGNANRSPNNLLGDGVDVNDLPFTTTFPYLASPHQGYGITTALDPEGARVRWVREVRWVRVGRVRCEGALGAGVDLVAQGFSPPSG